MSELQSLIEAHFIQRKKEEEELIALVNRIVRGLLCSMKQIYSNTTLKGGEASGHEWVSVFLHFSGKYCVFIPFSRK